jgi:hypothetical protein
MSTMIIQVELSAVPTEIKKSEDFRNRYSSAIIELCPKVGDGEIRRRFEVA